MSLSYLVTASSQSLLLIRRLQPTTELPSQLELDMGTGEKVGDGVGVEVGVEAEFEPRTVGPSML